jgi:hypothetical protein
METVIETRRRLEKEFTEKLRDAKMTFTDQLSRERKNTLDAMSLLSQLIVAIRKDEEKRGHSLVSTMIEATAAVQKWAAE